MFVTEGDFEFRDAPDAPAEGLPSDGDGLPPDYVAQAQRARILEALAECCAQRGYAATTISHIVERAGVSRATFYELFKDKEDCFMAAAHSLLGDLMTATTGAYSPDKPLVHFVRDAASSIVNLLAERPAFAQLAFIEYRTATPRALQVYQSGVRVIMSLLDQIRADAVTDAALPSSAARGAIGGAEAILRREVAAGRAAQLPQMLPQILYSCLVPFLGQDEALRQAALVKAR
jgi:AcrR family transcriptional regulator